MKVVGIREFKDRLSEYVRMARQGEDILLTDRGEVVAELRGPGAIGRPVHPDPGIADLIRRGVGLPNRYERTAGLPAPGSRSSRQDGGAIAG